MDSEDKLKIQQHRINKGHIIENWTTISITFESKTKLIGDCSVIWDTTSLIISERAKNLLNKKYNDYIQFLPLYYKENQYFYLLNILKSDQIFDYNNSQYSKYHLNGKTKDQL